MQDGQLTDHPARQRQRQRARPADAQWTVLQRHDGRHPGQDRRFDHVGTDSGHGAGGRIARTQAHLEKVRIDPPTFPQPRVRGGRGDEQRGRIRMGVPAKRDLVLGQSRHGLGRGEPLAMPGRPPFAPQPADADPIAQAQWQAGPAGTAEQRPGTEDCAGTRPAQRRPAPEQGPRPRVWPAALVRRIGRQIEPARRGGSSLGERLTMTRPSSPLVVAAGGVRTPAMDRVVSPRVR